MAIQCDDFTYSNQTLESFNCIAVDFDDNSEIPLALSREINKGETNTYRKVANHYGTKYSDVLKPSIHICKNPCIYTDQSQMIFSDEEVRNIIRWLTSSALPKWLKTTNKTKEKNYKGIFTNVETFCVGGNVMGLKLEFMCDSPYSYTEDVVNSKVVSGYTKLTVENNSDELEDYVYPIIKVNATTTGNIFMFNKTDSNILESGTLIITDSSAAKITYLISAINKYALMHGYITEYRKNEDTNDLLVIINDTAVQFKYIDKFGSKIECTAYFDSTNNYTIFEGGFMYLLVLRDNPITVDCGKYQIYDSLSREILLSDIGLEDVGQMYWMRLLNGKNEIRLFADNATFTFTHREERKDGVI